MKKPIQCVFWEKPELIEVGMMKDKFEFIETYNDESHLWRYLLKCRECGQLYFFQFYEEIDWEGGNDPQYTIYIPVETSEEIRELKKSWPLELIKFYPHLQIDFPKEAKEPRVWWSGK